MLAWAGKSSTPNAGADRSVRGLTRCRHAGRLSHVPSTMNASRSTTTRSRAPCSLAGGRKIHLFGASDLKGSRCHVLRFDHDGQAEEFGPDGCTCGVSTRIADLPAECVVRPAAVEPGAGRTGRGRRPIVQLSIESSPCRRGVHGRSHNPPEGSSGITSSRNPRSFGPAALCFLSGTLFSSGARRTGAGCRRSHGFSQGLGFVGFDRRSFLLFQWGPESASSKPRKVGK